MSSEAFLKNLLLPPSHKHGKEQMCTIKGETIFHIWKGTVHLLLSMARLNNKKNMMCLQVIKELKIKKGELCESSKEQIKELRKEWNCVGKNEPNFHPKKAGK